MSGLCPRRGSTRSWSI